MFLNAKDLFFQSLIFAAETVIFLLTAIYASLRSHRSDCSIDVLNLICLLDMYLSFALPG